MHPLHRLPAALMCVELALVAGGGLRAQSNQDHAYTSQDIQTGMRLYSGQCATCHGANGDTVSGINLRRGTFRRGAMSDEALRAVITIGVPGTGMPPFNFQPAELDGLVAFIRAGFDLGGTAIKIGDATRGKTVFEGKGACLSCHRVKGVGSRTAPDLTDVGTARSAAQLSRSLTAPATQMMPINRPVRIVTKDNKTIRGRRLNEDTYSVQIIDDKETLISIDKADIKELDVSKTSTMPPASDKLSGDEVSDVLAYLTSLRGQL